MGISEISSNLIPNTLRTILANDEPLAMVIKGTSMLPYLAAGDRVWLQQAEKTRLRVGDLVTFEQNQEILTHRIIKKSTSIFLTKGDNNLFPDLPLSSQKIIGKVVAYERNGTLYPIEGRRVALNRLLGFCHHWIGMMGQNLLRMDRISHGNLRRPLFWLGKVAFFPIKLFERVIRYVA